MIVSKYNFDLNRKTLYRIINEYGSVTPDMALRLSKAFKTTPDTASLSVADPLTVYGSGDVLLSVVSPPGLMIVYDGD
jgi:hypothetical protein